MDVNRLHVAPVLHWLASQRHRSLRCFAGYHFIDEKRSHAAWRSSCALVCTLFQSNLLIFRLAWLLSMAALCGQLCCCSGVSPATISTAPLREGKGAEKETEKRDGRPHSHTCGPTIRYLTPRSVAHPHPSTSLLSAFVGLLIYIYIYIH